MSRCTGYRDDRGKVAHDGPSCPIHEQPQPGPQPIPRDASLRYRLIRLGLG